MTTLSEIKTHAQQSAEEARRHLAEARMAKKAQYTQERTLALLEEQQQELKRLRHDLAKRQKSSGGFPWGLVLLAGAGYALYQSNPSVREQIQNLLKRLDPGMTGNVTRAGDAVKEAVSDLGQGKSPLDNLQRAAGEVRRGGEKGVEQAKTSLGEATGKAADDLRPGSSASGTNQA